MCPPALGAHDGPMFTIDTATTFGTDRARTLRADAEAEHLAAVARATDGGGDTTEKTAHRRLRLTGRARRRAAATGSVGQA